MAESKKESKADSKSAPNLQDLLEVKEEATRIYNFTMFVNEIVWKALQEEGGSMGVLDTIRLNMIVVYMMRLHTPAQPIRERFNKLVLQSYQANPIGFKLFAALCTSSPAFATTQEAIVDQDAFMEFLTTPEKRTPCLQIWLPKIQSCLDHLRDLYLACGDQDAKAYAEDYKQIQAYAEAHIWPKIWKLKTKQAVAIQDYVTPHRPDPKLHAGKVVSAEDRIKQWTLYLDAFQKFA